MTGAAASSGEQRDELNIKQHAVTDAQGCPRRLFMTVAKSVLHRRRSLAWQLAGRRLIDRRPRLRCQLVQLSIVRQGDMPLHPWSEVARKDHPRR